MRGTWLRIVGLLLFVSLLATGGGWWMLRGAGSPTKATDQPAKAATDQALAATAKDSLPRDSKDVLTLPGVIEPFESVPISARLTATIASIKVRDGSSVTKGQLLCVLDDSELRRNIDAAQVAYLQALELERKGEETKQVETQRKRVALETAQADLQSYTRQSKLQLDDAQAALTRAQHDLSDYQALYQAKAVSGDDVRTRREKEEDAQRAFQEQQAAMQAGLATRKQAVQQAQLDMDTETISEDALRANQTAVTEAKAELEDRQRRLTDTRILAPIGGTVRIIPRTRSSSMTESAQSAEVLGPGVRVYEGDPFLEIATTRRACVKVDVDETDVPRLHPGMKAKITGDAFPGRTLTGEIAIIPITGKKAGEGVSLFPVTVLVTSPLSRSSKVT